MTRRRPATVWFGYNVATMNMRVDAARRRISTSLYTSGSPCDQDLRKILTIPHNSELVT